jgi:hypothetical protein
MSRARLAGFVLGAGVLGAQAGHLLAYQLRFGAAAQQLESTGAHAYFPSIAKTGLGLAALAILTGGFVVAAARMVTGGRIEPGSAPAVVRLLALVYTIQLACFAGQETIEALLGGGPATSAPTLLLWGAMGQLPVAVAGSLAIRWLLVRVRPALAELRLGSAPSFLVTPVVLRARPVVSERAVAIEVRDDSYVRGPPSF